MPFRYSITIAMIFVVLAFSRGFVLQHYSELSPFNILHALAEGDGGGGAGGGDDGAGGAGGGEDGAGGAGGGEDGAGGAGAPVDTGTPDDVGTPSGEEAADDAVPAPTPVCIITTSPSEILLGGSAALAWGFSSDVTSLTINNGIGVKTSRGYSIVTPNTSTTYSGVAASPYGSATCSANVAVTTPPPPPIIYGCMDPSATNYNPAATSQTGVTCTYPLPPPPPPTPVPTCILTTSPSEILLGGSAALAWGFSSDVTSLTINNGIGVKTSRGYSIVTPNTSTTYSGVAASPYGSATCSANVAVTTPPPPPIIYGCMDPSATNYNPAATSQTGVTCTYPLPPPPPPAPTCMLTATPSSITTGASSVLSWATANATTFSVNNGIGSVMPVAVGSRSVTPAASVTYTATATGAGGTATCAIAVTVTATPPPPPPSAPTCTLAASPVAVQEGDSSTLAWTAGNATSFSINQGIGSVTPVAAGSRSVTPAASVTYTGTATGTGGTVTCATAVTVTATPPPPAAPTCTLTAFPTSITTGSSSTLSWTTTNATAFVIDNGIGTSTPVASSTVSVSPSVTVTYTGTAINNAVGTTTCAAAVTVTTPSPPGGGGSGGGGGRSNFGAATLSIPNITLAALARVGAQPLAFLYLSQIPYTGLELGPVGAVLYWTALIGWALALAYLVLFGAVPFANRRLCAFGFRLSEALNIRQKPISESQTPATASGILSEAPRGYSTYEGFKSFAHNGALSIDDIVKGLARVHSPSSILHPPASRVEPIYEQVEPIYEYVEPITPDVNTAGFATHAASIKGFAAALIEGDRTAVFAGLRQHIRGGGAPERLLSEIVCLIDDAYRARVDGTACDPEIARLVARLSTPTLERFIAALTTAIDASYSAGVTGAKLALTRALSILGA